MQIQGIDRKLIQYLQTYFNFSSALNNEAGLLKGLEQNKDSTLEDKHEIDNLDLDKDGKSTQGNKEGNFNILEDYKMMGH